MESAVSDLRTALKGDDRGVIEKKTEALAQASAAIAQRAHAAEQGGPGSGAERRGGGRPARAAATARPGPRPVAARRGVRTWWTRNSKR